MWRNHMNSNDHTSFFSSWKHYIINSSQEICSFTFEVHLGNVQSIIQLDIASLSVIILYLNKKNHFLFQNFHKIIFNVTLIWKTPLWILECFWVWYQFFRDWEKNSILVNTWFQRFAEGDLNTSLKKKLNFVNHLNLWLTYTQKIYEIW